MSPFTEAGGSQESVSVEVSGASAWAGFRYPALLVSLMSKNLLPLELFTFSSSARRLLRSE
jgi:hypothetical protein